MAPCAGPEARPDNVVPLPMPAPMTSPAPIVTAVAALPDGALSALLAPYGLELRCVPDGQPIPGSYWGESEAGLIGNVLFVRSDTPVHSALHEACHWLCMDADRRAALHTDAGGDDTEEAAACYLQVILTSHLAGYDRSRLFADMDAWGYHFRLGSTRAWFEGDSDDAHDWLQRHRAHLLPQQSS